MKPARMFRRPRASRAAYDRFVTRRTRALRRIRKIPGLRPLGWSLFGHHRSTRSPSARTQAVAEAVLHIMGHIRRAAAAA